MIKKIIPGIFIAAALFFTVWGVYYVSSPVNSVDVVTETVEHAVNDPSAVIIRDETVYYSDISGTLYSSVSEGERVAKDSLVCTVFGGGVSSDSLNELRMIDKNIERRKELMSRSSVYISDGADTEGRIAALVRRVSEAAGDSDVMRIADIKDEINSLRSGVEISGEDLLQSLILEKEAVEDRISTEKFDITAGMSGIYMTYTDGLETALRPENIKEYTVESINGITIPEARRLAADSVEAGGVVFKIANNHVWYAALVVPTAEIEGHEEGEKVTLRFNSSGGRTVEGELYFISENDENGSKLAAVRCPSYFDDAFSYRSADIDMIFESYTGVKVPVYAIRSDENGQYAAGMKGSAEYKCYCDILYTDTENEFLIIETSDTSPARLEDMDRIIIGER